MGRTQRIPVRVGFCEAWGVGGRVKVTRSMAVVVPLAEITLPVAIPVVIVGKPAA